MRRRGKKPLQRGLDEFNSNVRIPKTPSSEGRQDFAEAVREFELHASHFSDVEREAIQRGIHAAEVGSFAPGRNGRVVSSAPGSLAAGKCGSNYVSYGILGHMTKLLEEAMAKVSQLPEATQESIAEDLIAHINGVEILRAELQKGIESLDRGEGQELDIEQVIRTARTAYERD